MKVFALIAMFAVVGYVSAALVPVYASTVNITTDVTWLRSSIEKKPMIIETTPVDGESLSISSVRGDFICSVGGIIAGGIICTAECLLQGYPGGMCLDDSCLCLNRQDV